MRSAAAVVALAVLLAGCAELVRWPDRMTQRPERKRAEPAPEGHYVVKPGDTMYSIAFRHQLDFRELAVWNDVGPDWLIHPGQVIRLSPPPVAAGSTGPSIVTTPMEKPERPPVYTPPPDPPPMAASQWRWPVAGPVIERFSDDGKGIDIGGTVGQPVVAAAAGKVVYSGAALKGYGELIIVKHDDVHLSAYGYNRRRLVAEGAQVTAGQPIAELGVGPEQKPALHFEIRRKGKPVNPMEYLPQR